MRKLVLKMSISLDGYVGADDGAVTPLINLSDDASLAWEMEIISGAGAHLMGRKTFHDMAAWWPTSTEPFAEPMNRIPKIVFTRSTDFEPAAPGETTGALSSMDDLKDAPPPRAEANAATLESWRNPEVLVGDLAGNIARLTQREGSFLLAHGGAGFARALIATSLVDEYQLLVHPIVLGSGLPIFTELTAPMELELVDSKPFPVGAVAQTYRPRSR